MSTYGGGHRSEVRKQLHRMAVEANRWDVEKIVASLQAKQGPLVRPGRERVRLMGRFR